MQKAKFVTGALKGDAPKNDLNEAIVDYLTKTKKESQNIATKIDTACENSIQVLKKGILKGVVAPPPDKRPKNNKEKLAQAVVRTCFIGRFTRQ